MPNLLTLETKKYAIKIDNFEGPLDLLIYLIEKNKMNIYDINLTQITEQYMEYLNAMEELKKWKESRNRKPLIIRGARQVGKTWLMKEFGKEYYDKCAYINFDDNTRMNKLFEEDFDLDRIILRNLFSKRITKMQEEIELPKRKLEKNYENDLIPQVYKDLLERTSQRLNQNAKNIEKIALVENYTVASKVREMVRVLFKQKRFVFNKLFSIKQKDKQEVIGIIKKKQSCNKSRRNLWRYYG